MKVAIDSRSLEGQKTGVGRYLINLLKFWKDKKEVRFILYFQNSIPEGGILNSSNFLKKVIKNPAGLESNAFWQHFTLPQALKKDKPDFFFSPSYLLPYFSPKKSAVTIHDISYQAHPEWFSPANRILLKRMSFRAARKAEIIFVPSQFSKNEIVKYYKVRPEKIKVTLLGIDASFKPLDNPEKINRIKEKYGIRNKFIFYIGSIFNRRHIPEIIEAFKGLNLFDYQFLIVGKNHTYPFIDLEKKIKETNNLLKREAVIQKDFLPDEDLVRAYQASSLFIWLSDYEGFGLPVLEAMSCRTPVITTKAGSIPEVAGESAFYLKKPDDYKEISQAINKVLTDEFLRKNLIKKGLSQVKKFSWQKCAEETLNSIVL
jgi:glycosyltransferase involved in cell wall biosynthesis